VIGPPGPPENHLAPNREPAQRYSTWKRDTQLGTVLIDQRPSDGEEDGVIVVGRFKGDPYNGVQLSYDAGRRKLYLNPRWTLRLAFLLAAAEGISRSGRARHQKYAKCWTNASA
jgi:hypothetical protein